MKQVRVAELKARLSEHLRYVRRGHELTVLDRETPIARVVPVTRPARLSTRGPAGRYANLRAVPLPRPLKLGVDVVEVLLCERQVER